MISIQVYSEKFRYGLSAFCIERAVARYTDIFFWHFDK